MMTTVIAPIRSRRPFGRAAGAPAGLLVAAALFLAPAPALAQFTTAVQPPARDSAPATVAAAESVVVARRDSVVQAQRTDLRAWVDSAASALAAAAPMDTAVPPDDSVAAVVGAPPARPAPSAPTTEFREGAPAPATATPLPLLLLAGGALAGLGAALRRR